MFYSAGRPTDGRPDGIAEWANYSAAEWRGENSGFTLPGGIGVEFIFAKNLAGKNPVKKILVFGACSAIAESLSRIFAARGDALFLVARDAERLEAVRADLALRGGGLAASAAADLREVSAHAELFSRAESALGGLDVVVIAHGVLPDQRECDESAEKALEMIHVNGVSAVSLMALAASRFEKRGRGQIAVISSVAGDRGRGGNYVYGAGKALVSVYAQGLRNRLHGRGVGVLTVKPGFVDTPMTAKFKKGALWAKPEEVAEGIARALDRGRDEVYLPWFWRPIMAVIRAVPEFIFKRLSL